MLRQSAMIMNEHYPTANLLQIFLIIYLMITYTYMHKMFPSIKKYL